MGKVADGFGDAGLGSSLVVDIFVSETASADTGECEDPAGWEADLSTPVLNQNQPFALQSIECGNFVIRLSLSLAGRDLWSAIVSRLCQPSSDLRRSQPHEGGESKGTWEWTRQGQSVGLEAKPVGTRAASKQ